MLRAQRHDRYLDTNVLTLLTQETVTVGPRAQNQLNQLVQMNRKMGPLLYIYHHDSF